MAEMAVLGFGTVGSGVVELIDINQQQIRKSVPEGLHVRYILDLRDFPGNPYQDRVVHDFNIILNDPEISLIAETMGGKGAAYQFSRAALEKGISVCTSNKELVEAYGDELMKTAREHGCSYLFEASTGGGIPILRPLRTSLSQEKITQVYGILNGTTNYILTRMRLENMGFNVALTKAQEYGYAEAKPEADIEGYDPCRKIAILSSLITGKKVDFEKIPCEGITEIGTTDFVYAEKMNCSIKLLGTSRLNEADGRIYVRTAPFLVSRTNPLYSVEDVYNGIFVHGNTVGDLMFYGSGAGKFPTASAVVGDALELAATRGTTIPGGWSEEKMELGDPLCEQHRFFVRVLEQEESLARYLFGSSIKRISNPNKEREFAFTTPLMSEGEFEEKRRQLKTVRNRIRFLDS